MKGLIYHLLSSFLWCGAVYTDIFCGFRAFLQFYRCEDYWFPMRSERAEPQHYKRINIIWTREKNRTVVRVTEKGSVLVMKKRKQITRFCLPATNAVLPSLLSPPSHQSSIHRPFSHNKLCSIFGSAGAAYSLKTCAVWHAHATGHNIYVH